MELAHQSHKEVPVGWFAALTGLFARRRRTRLLLTGPVSPVDCRPHGGIA